MKGKAYGADCLQWDRRERNVVAAGMIIFIGISFMIALEMELYGYFISFLLGLFLYILSVKYGKEIYLLLPIPILLITPALSGNLFILDYYNRDGLNHLKLHPFTVVWLVILFLEAADGILSKKIFFDRAVFWGGATIIIFSAVTLIFRGMNGMPIAMENYLGPITFFLFFYSCKSININRARRIGAVYIFIAAVIGLTGIVEYFQQHNFLNGVYADIPFSWLDGTFYGGYRIKTVIGHPLSNALVFIMAMALTQVIIENKLIRYGTQLFFSALILLTGSRSIFLLSLLMIVYEKRQLQAKLKRKREFITALVVVVAILLITFLTPFGDTFLQRMETGEASTQARIVLVRYFLNHLNSFHIRGLGGSESIRIPGDNAEYIIMENPWIILFLDVSYLFLFYILFVVIVLQKMDDWYLVLIFMIALSSSNSFGVKDTSNYMLYYLISYCYINQRFYGQSEENLVSCTKFQISQIPASGKK